LSPEQLRHAVLEVCAAERPERSAVLPVVAALLDALEAGVVRAAEPAAGGWRVNAWVKQGILLAFRAGHDVGRSIAPFHFRDRDTLDTWNPCSVERGIRIVPGGTAVRRGAHLGDRVVIMPPAYVNVGAWVGADTMIDSHALVGSCAQVGRQVHLSAAAQLGGVLEPVGALPVIVEDGGFVGGGCGIYEGARVGARAVLAPGVVLTAAVAVFDLVREAVHRAGADGVLEIPAGAVVVPGARPARGAWARQHELSLHAPVIVKYRDAATDAAVALEEALR